MNAHELKAALAEREARGHDSSVVERAFAQVCAHADRIIASIHERRSRPWYRVHTSTILLVLLAIILALACTACATPAPSPVSITPVSLDGIARPIRKAVSSNAVILTHAQRQQVLLAEAEALLRGRTLSK